MKPNLPLFIQSRYELAIKISYVQINIYIPVYIYKVTYANKINP